MPLQPNGLLIDEVTPLHVKIQNIRHVARNISQITTAIQTDGFRPATLCIELIEYCNRPLVKEHASCLASFFGQFEHHPDHLLSLQALEASGNADEPMNRRIRFFASRLDIALRVDLFNISELLYYTENIDHIIETEQNSFRTIFTGDVDDQFYNLARIYSHSSAPVLHQMHLQHDLYENFKSRFFLHSRDYLQLLTKARGQLMRILGEAEYMRKFRIVSEFLNYNQESEEGVAGNHQPGDIFE